MEAGRNMGDSRRSSDPIRPGVKGRSSPNLDSMGTGQTNPRTCLESIPHAISGFASLYVFRLPPVRIL